MCEQLSVKIYTDRQYFILLLNAVSAMNRGRSVSEYIQRYLISGSPGLGKGKSPSSTATALRFSKFRLIPRRLHSIDSDEFRSQAGLFNKELQRKKICNAKPLFTNVFKRLPLYIDRQEKQKEFEFKKYKVQIHSLLNFFFYIQLNSNCFQQKFPDFTSDLPSFVIKFIWNWQSTLLLYIIDAEFVLATKTDKGNTLFTLNYFLDIFSDNFSKNKPNFFIILQNLLIMSNI